MSGFFLKNIEPIFVKTLIKLLSIIILVNCSTIKVLSNPTMLAEHLFCKKINNHDGLTLY